MSSEYLIIKQTKLKILTLHIVSIILLSQLSISLLAEEEDFKSYNYSQNTYGGIGLIQTPSARFSEDGEFLFGFSSEHPYNRMFSKMQIFPWLEAVVRYTEGKYKPYQDGIQQTWKDKGIDFKIKLINESAKLPQLAIGLTDFGGTGAYSSEYIVASKRISDIDFTIGMGWGKLAGLDHLNNFVGEFDKDRSVRGGYESLGGKINLKRFFSGENISIFGGLEYFTPIDNLSLKIEYDTSDYSDVEGIESNFFKIGDIFSVDSRFNYSLNYSLRPSERDKVDFSLGFIRGNTIYTNVSLHSNLNFRGTPKIVIGGEKLRNTNLRARSYIDLDRNRKKFLTDRIIKEMANAGFVTHRIIFNDNELAAEISQGVYQETLNFIDLASRILANNALPNIDTLTVINIDQGIETLRSSINRDVLKNAALTGPTPVELINFNNYSIVEDETLIIENEYLYPNFYWEIRPTALGTLQHQERFYFWQLQALIHTEYSFRKGLYLTTDIGINIANNFEDYTYHIPDGELYHVRQDRRLFLTEGESGIRKMAFDYLIDINPNIKAKLSAGYLEWMFGGIGGEVIYMPESKNWALGFDAYYVKQRDFDQKFSFQDYNTLTGFLTYYRDIPFYDLRLKVSAGKYLANDKGVTVDISRRFKTGARVGGMVALTDCDPACVGEGSFNKWIYFELPMDLFYLSSSTRNKTGYSWAPLTKDAGQRIEVGSLYGLMMSATDEVDSLRQKQWSFKKILSGFGTKPKSQKL
ncbi:MAG: hypothetical protein CMD35_01925 [Flavobacteriales bacterium]|nr:hypothetical protein [Flavobacteriales bacterium]